jgi:hypothetical protein
MKKTKPIQLIPLNPKTIKGVKDGSLIWISSNEDELISGIYHAVNRFDSYQGDSYLLFDRDIADLKDGYCARNRLYFVPTGIYLNSGNFWIVEKSLTNPKKQGKVKA